MDEWKFSRRQTNGESKVKDKFDPSRIKDKRYQKKQYDDSFDEAEYLQIQGLIRCKVCEAPYPQFLEKCPVCK